MGDNKLLIYFAVLLCAAVISFFAMQAQFDVKTIGILMFLLVFIPTIINPDIGFVIIIISMLFSPDIIVGKTGSREITLRIEDIFLLVVILATLIRTALAKDMSQVFKTRLTAPFFWYIGVCIISSIWSSMFGVVDLGKSFFSILKYIEYFLLFLIVRDNLRSVRQVKIFTAVFLIVALLVGIYSNRYIQQQESAGITYFRTRPPVERGEGGEANTLGGYIVFMMAIAAGLLLYLRAPGVRLFLICLILLIFRGFLYSLSRGSYLAFIPMVVALIYFSRKITFTYVAVIFLFLTVILLPTMVRQRIVTTVVAKEGERGVYLELEESPKNRLDSFKDVLFGKLPESPIFGHGVGRYFIDGQIFLTLCEVGLMGFIIFALLLTRLFKMAREVLSNDLVKEDGFSRGLTTGFLAGFVGLLAQAVSANTFILIRIMEPFWFMAAMVLSLPALLQRQKGEVVEAAAT